jgi:proline iminopeptidase
MVPPKAAPDFAGAKPATAADSRPPQTWAAEYDLSIDVRLSDGYRLFVKDLGHGLPLILLHGGPGLDHTMFRPWLDPLADEFRLLYVDARGQGRSDRVDPETLTLSVWARDVDLLAIALELDRFAVLGHSFGAIIATTHAIERGTAAGYVISGGGDSSAALEADVTASLEALGAEGAAIVKSWEDEKTVETEAEFAALMEAQMPFHFAGVAPQDFCAETVYAPEVLRHAANMGYGDFDYPPQLDLVRKPTLVLVGEKDRTTTPRAARVLHEGIKASELVVIPDVGHMSYVEAQEAYLDAVRKFLRRIAEGQSPP